MMKMFRPGHQRSDTQPMSRQVVLPDGGTASHVRLHFPDGDDGVWATLALMEALARRDARDERLLAIVQANRGRSDSETARNLFMHVVRHYPYRDDPEDREFVTAPVYVLTGQSPFDYQDCDDLATALAALLTAAGIRNSFVVIAWRPDAGDAFTHVYNEAWLDGRWRPMDLVMRASGWMNEKREIRRRQRWELGRMQLPNAFPHVSLNDSVQNATELSDDVRYPDINWAGIAKDILTRALPEPLGRGEDAGEVLKQHVVAICLASVKEQLRGYRTTIAAVAVGSGVGLLALGFAIGRLTRRTSSRRTSGAASPARHDTTLRDMGQRTSARGQSRRRTTRTPTREAV